MKLKSLIEAKGPDVEPVVKKIAAHTDRNAHTEALIEIAKFINNKKLEKILNGILELHLEMGHMPPELQALRSNIGKELMQLVDRKYGKDVLKQIHDAL